MRFWHARGRRDASPTSAQKKQKMQKKTAATCSGPARKAGSAVMGAVMSAALVAGMATVMLDPAPAVADAGASGYPGLATERGFTGWVLSNGRQLGIATLANGTIGVCLDAGAHAWPGTVVTPASVKNPGVAYALSQWLPKARNNATTAAALWAATAIDLGQNSNPAYVKGSIADFHAQFPAAAGQMEATRRQIVTAAKNYAAPSSGYTTASLTIRHTGTSARGGLGAVGGIGTRSAAGKFVPGAAVRLTLSGAKWLRNNAASITVTSSAAAQSLSWFHTTPGKVTVTETITGLSATVFRRQPAVNGSQRVGFSAGTVRISGARSLDDHAWLRIRKVDAKTGKALTGAAFTVFQDLNANGTRQTNEKQQSLTTRTGGLTVSYVGFAASQICLKETKAPSGYVKSAATICRRVGSTTTAAKPAVVVVKNTTVPSQVRYPLVVTKTIDASDPGDLAGLVGVTVQVRQGSATGAVVSGMTHSFTAADVRGGAASYNFGAHFEQNTTYWVVITKEPAGFAPDQAAVQATLSTNASGTPVSFGAALLDWKIWQPHLVTQVSAQSVSPGVQISDQVVVTTTGGNTVTGHWKLLGPVAPAMSGDQPSCAGVSWDGAPTAATGDFTVAGNGTYTVGAYSVTRTGCFTYVESTDAGTHTSASPWTPAGTASETTLSTSTPKLVTQINHQSARPGVSLVDRVKVTETYGATVAGTWRLLGPIAPSTAGACPTRSGAWAGAPVAASGVFTATGDGTYTVGAHRAEAAGCYTYVEALASSPTTQPVPTTPAGIPAETSLVMAHPTLATQVNHRTATAGVTLTDKVMITGTGGATVHGQWRLYGIAPTPAGSCRRVTWSKARLLASGSFTRTGDGSMTVGSHKIAAAMCATYSERLLGSGELAGTVWTPPGLTTETSVIRPVQPAVPAHPTVPTGDDEATATWIRQVRTVLALAAPGSGTVAIPAVGLKAGVETVRFTGSALHPPANVHLGGIWNRGAGFNALAGTTVVVGHVSDDHDRPGAFKSLNRVKVGQKVTTRSGGTTHTWRVVSIRTPLRTQLRRAIFAQSMTRRLVLVTCTGEVHYADGSFHYTRNRVVTAVPVR